MANRLFIQTDTDARIHFDYGAQDYTLCGLETIGDTAIGIQQGIPTNKRVTCPECIRRVRFCKSIKSREMKEQNDDK